MSSKPSARIQHAARVTESCEKAIDRACHDLRGERRINSLGVYVDRWTVVMNLKTAKAAVDTAIAVAESCDWPTSGDYLEVV